MFSQTNCSTSYVNRIAWLCTLFKNTQMPSPASTAHKHMWAISWHDPNHKFFQPITTRWLKIYIQHRLSYQNKCELTRNCLRQKLMPAHPTLMPSHGFKDDAVLFEPSCHTAYCYLTVVVTAHSQFIHETLHSSSIVNRIIPLYAGPSTKEFSISLTYLPRLNR